MYSNNSNRTHPGCLSLDRTEECEEAGHLQHRMAKYPAMSRLIRYWWHLVDWGFTQLYTNLAWAYDAVAWSVSGGQWIQWGQTALAWVQGPQVLEIGCGPGHLLVALARAGHTPYAIDQSPHMLRLAQKKLRRQGLRAGLVQGRAQHLPWPADSFDAVVMTFPAGFALQPATYAEIRRVLRPAGRSIMVSGARMQDGVYGRLVNLAFRLTSGTGGDLRYLQQVLERHGFAVVHHVVERPNSQVDLFIATPA